MSITSEAARNAVGTDNVRMITASAGTGKTYTLMQEISAQIDAGIRPDQILATTFTKKAAAELSARVREKLFSSEHPEEARQMSVSMVGTVNSVCGRLLAEYAVDAGLSPLLQTIDATEQARIFNLATDNVFTKYTPRIQPLADRISFAGDEELEYSGTDWRATVRNISAAARSNRINAQGLSDSSAASWAGIRHLLDVPGSDNRARWVHQVRQAVISIEAHHVALLDAGKKVPGNLVTDLGKLRTLGAITDPEAQPWTTWLGVRGSNAEVTRQLEPLVSEIDSSLLSNPGLHTDLKNFILAMFDCAAECLEAFASFKQTYGLVDFTDQEALVLELLETNDSFQNSIGQRIKFMVVDEFQDTSPLQLQLFTRFAGLVDKVVWVGDAKQAIYEFRGTDPELMKAVADTVSDRRQLRHSWRSSERVIGLSNLLSSAVFPQLTPGDFELRVPTPEMSKEAAQRAIGGHREVWTLGYLKGGKKDVNARCQAAAAGAVDLIQRRGLKPRDVAVLARTNDEVEFISAALAALGVKANTNTSGLFTSREVQLVRAGMAFVASEWDTVALAELVHLHPEHPAHGRWVEDLFEGGDPSMARQAWARADLLTDLVELRQSASLSTPTDLLQEVVHHLGVVELIKSWSNPSMRLKNLDAFRALLEKYYESSAALGKPVTLSGALTFVAGSEATGSDNYGDNVVNVLTYHQSKGLEWPAVVLASLDRKVTAKSFGVAVEARGEVDVARPLDGRWIRFWPYPFGRHMNKRLHDAANATEVAGNALRRQQSDAARVLYVGMTRAAEVCCLTAAEPEAPWLNGLVPGTRIYWDSDASGDGRLVVDGAGATASMDVEAFSYTPVESPPTGSEGRPPSYTDVLRAAARAAAVGLLPASIKASAVESDGLHATIEEVANLGPQLISGGSATWRLVGSAIHGYLALPLDAVTAENRVFAAQRLIDRWGVGGYISAELVVESGRRMSAYFAGRYPGSRLITEQSVRHRTPEHQTMQGWIDLLVETPAGLILVDHKSYPGDDPKAHIRSENLGQMKLYEQSIEAATGKPVLATLIHLPALGKIYSVETTHVTDSRELS